MTRTFLPFCFILITCLFSCIKENEIYSPTYFQATVDGKKLNISSTQASIQQLIYNLNYDTVYYLNIYGINSDTDKIVSIGLQILKCDTGEYVFNLLNDSIKLIEATYKPDSSYFSTRFNPDSINSGKLHITEWEKSYIKGNFEFVATSNNQPGKVVRITNGSFYSNFK